MADCDAVDFLKAWNLEQYIDVFRGKYLLIFDTLLFSLLFIAEGAKIFFPVDHVLNFCRPLIFD